MNQLIDCPPWLEKKAQLILDRMQQGRLHHAHLITGVEGVGKSLFCGWLVQALLCESPTSQRACGRCAGCQHMRFGTHPDLRSVEPDGAGAAIKIDRIRELVQWLQLTASQGRHRVAFIARADSLNQAAANSLLKTLEEPADKAVLVLCADRSNALPATIRSRCQRLTLTNENTAASIEWLSTQVSDAKAQLALARGAPLKVLQYQSEAYQTVQKTLIKAWLTLFQRQSSVGRIAESLSALEVKECLTHFANWSALATQRSLGMGLKAAPDVEAAIALTHERLSLLQWFQLYDRVLALHRADSVSFKTQAVLEGLFADIRIACQSPQYSL